MFNKIDNDVYEKICNMLFEFHNIMNFHTIKSILNMGF